MCLTRLLTLMAIAPSWPWDRLEKSGAQVGMSRLPCKGNVGLAADDAFNQAQRSSAVKCLRKRLCLVIRTPRTLSALAFTSQITSAA